MARKEDNMSAPVDTDALADMEGDTAGAVMVRQSSEIALGEVSGDLSPTSIRLPRLQLTFGVGKLAAEFAPGDWVLGGDTLLAHKMEKLNFIVIHAHGYWKEYTTQEMFAAGIRPRTFESEAEVKAAGGTTQWINGKGPSFSQAVDFKILIEQPKDLVSGVFGIPIGGKQYAPAIWTLDKTSYSRGAPPILTAAKFALRQRGLHSAVWELFSKIETMNGKNIPVPSVKLSRHLSDGEIAELRDLFQGGAAPVADPAV